MSLLEYLYEWHEPHEVKKQTELVLRAGVKSVHFSYSSADMAEIEKAHKLASRLDMDYQAEPVEMRLAASGAEIRFNEGVATKIEE